MIELAGGDLIRLLDFDIETRKVGFHNGGRFGPDGCEPTAIAAGWSDQDQVRCWLLGVHDPVEMLTEFRKMWDRADCVTGHYILKFDLPILNAAMLENGLPLLDEKLASDTKVDLRHIAGLSQSQENLSDMLRVVDEKKFHMNDNRWRESNRLTPAGIRLAKKRATDDVRQHRALRRELIRAGALRAPRVWRA